MRVACGDSRAKTPPLAARPKTPYLRVYASPLLESEECVAIHEKSNKHIPGNIHIEFQTKYESETWTLGSLMRKDDARFQLHWMISRQLSTVRASAHRGPYPNFFLRLTCCHTCTNATMDKKYCRTLYRVNTQRTGNVQPRTKHTAPSNCFEGQNGVPSSEHSILSHGDFLNVMFMLAKHQLILAEHFESHGSEKPKPYLTAQTYTAPKYFNRLAPS